MRRLDEIDRRILRELQRDGRITNQALADRVGLSPRACLDRVRRLERERVIAGYRAIVDRSALGDALVVHAEVTLVDQRQSTLQQFERRAAQCEEVIACHLLSGPYDYLVRFACSDVEHYRRISDAWINDRSLGVARIVSHAELATVKEFVGYPV
ncbi:MAG TPA: winged helix-turn-helix transcriptional regulator [Zeimonas sp.]|nr:winged helix-turn-helix transcriptional regulator [Zeimonas sp.]